MPSDHLFSDAIYVAQQRNFDFSKFLSVYATLCHDLHQISFLHNNRKKRNAPTKSRGDRNRKRYSSVLLFSHPDYTVGAGISPAQRRFRRSRTSLCKLHRRCGISPTPKVFVCQTTRKAKSHAKIICLLSVLCSVTAVNAEQNTHIIKHHAIQLSGTLRYSNE